ncbi:MAG: glycosyltransferase, partial [Planctomycetota bacterium]
MASITSPIPLVPGVDGHQTRPRFSVMLPTYEPGEQLRRTLQSVLSQAPDREEMQIAVVDDGSRHADVVGLVRSIDPHGRIDIHVDGGHLGIAGNWNRAIGLAHGHLVHLLHQDDQVLPGFYDRMAQAFLQAPLLGMAFCRSSIIDTAGRLIKINSRQRLWPGVLSDWLPKIATRQRIQTPAVVVARTTYEILGGYRTDLCQTLDWEMWVRIAARLPVWYDPRTLAVFRRHAASESARL